MDLVKEDSPRSSGRSGAPALEKGLDILEALADEPDALSQKSIAEKVGRSVSEIFRMLGALEERGYVSRDADTGHYRLTLHLFELAHRHSPTRRLQQAALVSMHKLSQEIGHACHLVTTHGDRLIVVSQVQPERLLMGWSVKVGAVFPFGGRYASARVIAAFQPPEMFEHNISRMNQNADAAEVELLRRSVARITEEGIEVAPSRIAPGVTDVSCPILDHFGHAVAALTIPFVPVPEGVPNDAALQDTLKRAAAAITIAIGGRSDLQTTTKE